MKMSINGKGKKIIKNGETGIMKRQGPQSGYCLLLSNGSMTVCHDGSSVCNRKFPYKVFKSTVSVLHEQCRLY